MKLQFFKKTGLTIIASFIFAASFSQTTNSKGGSMDYEVLTDNPNKLKPILIGLNPLVADTWNTNSYMGIGAFLHVNILKYGSVSFDWKKAYFDMVKGIKNHRGIEIGLAYNLFSFETNKDMQVVLSSSLTFTETRRTQYTTFITVPGTAKKIVQVRGGLNNLKTAIDSYDFGTSAFLFDNDTAIKIKTFSAQTVMNYVYGGISWHTINNLVIKHSGSSLATNCNDYNFYADFLYQPFDLKFPTLISRNVFSDEITPLPYEMTIIENSKLKKAGWRLGWEARKNNIKGAFTYKVEFGVRPGLTGTKKGILAENSFMVLSAGFTFPAGNKKILNY